jgi:hypothetical protein
MNDPILRLARFTPWIVCAMLCVPIVWVCMQDLHVGALYAMTVAIAWIGGAAHVAVSLAAELDAQDRARAARKGGRSR